MMVTVFKSLFNSNDVPYYISLDKALDRIKQGKSKDLIEKIRSEEDKEKRNKLKQSSICILFNGTFSTRNISGFENHSGFMITDWDGYTNDEDMVSNFEYLKSIPYIVSVFVSPSGNGYKAIVKIPPCTAKEHSQYFTRFALEFGNEYFDNKNSDVSRVCFESYDPNIWINDNYEEYNPELIEEGYDVAERVPLVPITDEMQIIDRIMKFDWKKDFIEGERNAFIFDLAGMMCEYGISEMTAKGYIISNIVYGGFSEREMNNAIESAYKRRQFNIKYFEDYNKANAIQNDLKHGKEFVKDKYKIDDRTFEQIKEVNDDLEFWYYQEDAKGNMKIKIDPLKYKFFLERNGYFKYFPDGASKPTWVRQKSNKVSETSAEKIKDFVLNHLMDKKEFDIWSYVASYQNMFSEQFLLMLDTIELMMLKDSKDVSFIAFKNGILRVDKKSAELIDYIDVDGYIWENQIIPLDWVKTETDDNDYKKFIKNISGGNVIPIETTIGYLLSTYKNKLNNKAVILNDEVISDNPEGGTGKGLFVQGIKQVRRVSILDGKSFNDQKSFPYQTVTQDTQILVFDDVKKNFDFESKFSLVTEGMTLERKNKDAIKLSVEDSPKLLISTNYAIKGEGNSHERRRYELEFAQYYGRNLTPSDEFGRELFSDWNIDDFNRFYNYMVSCLIKYLNRGLVTQEGANFKLRKFIAETSMEFYEWISDTENPPIPLKRRNDKAESYDEFVNQYQDFKKWLSRRKFNSWVQKWAVYSNNEYYSPKGSKWFTLGEPEHFEDNNEDDPF